MRQLASLLAACVALLGLASGARAASVVVLGPHGHAVRTQNRFVPAAEDTPAPSSPPAPRTISVPRATADIAHAAARRGPTPDAVLHSLLAAGTITRATYQTDRGILGAASTSLRRLQGTRHTELGAVIANLDAIAASGQLTASRLPALFMTLARNRQWWTTGPLLAPDQRVMFTGSQIVWEYYPGQGIELQELGSFGEANGFYTAGPSDYGKLTSLLAELIPLASQRAGGLAWEYYFHFDGGSPPWASAMAQATAIEALARAYEATHQTSYLQTAHDALPLLERGPPAGAAIHTSRGIRFLQYTFAPATKIINAFLQTLIGLDTYAQASGDQTAQQLFAAGNAEAMAELPAYNTGAWSLYQPGLEDDLSYHELVTGFLQTLCQLTQAHVYCTTASAFATDETTPPTLTQLTMHGPAHHAFSLAFRLSKVSHVGIVVLRGSQTLFATSAQFPYGTHSFRVPALAPGTYQLHLAATDLANNFGRIVGTLQIS